MAHSDAVFTDIEWVVECGYTIMTHLYSDMKGTERKNAYRIAGAVEDGVAKLMNRRAFAGSVATTDRLYRTMAQAIGKDMVALSCMSSLTPARAMGWNDRGEIAVGKRADLLLLNEQLEILQVITDKKN